MTASDNLLPHNPLQADLGPLDSKRLYGNAPIGYAITGNELCVVKSNKSNKSEDSQQDGEIDELELFEIVPDGTPGELLVGGVQLADGYHNREYETAQRFIPYNRIINRDGSSEGISDISGSSSFLEGKKLFRTGDIVVRIPISMGSGDSLPAIPINECGPLEGSSRGSGESCSSSGLTYGSSSSSVVDHCESILDRGDEWCNKWAGSILWLGRSDLQVGIGERHITSSIRLCICVSV